MGRFIEPGPGIKQGLRDFKCNVSNVTAFVTGIVFSLSGAVILYANTAAKANLTHQQAASWVMSGYIIGAILSIIMSLYYKQPLFLAPSLTALLVMGPMFKTFTVQEMIAGYLIGAVIVFILGITGLVGLIGRYLPIPIVMGMIGGVFMTYGLGMVNSVKSAPVVGGLTILAYLITPLFTKKIPQQAVALIVAIILSFALLPFNAKSGGALQMSGPVFILPDFHNPNVIISVSIPLVLMGLADTLKGYGVLRANEYDVPLNTMTNFCGITSFIGSFFLCHDVMVAGPVLAIVGSSTAGPKEHRYVASILKSLSMIVVGITAGIIMPFLMSLPVAVSGVIAGLAMLGLFTGALEGAFGSKKFQLGAFAAFIVGLSNLSLWNIGAPVWALLIGLVVSLFLEREHFKQIKQSKKVSGTVLAHS